MVSIPLESGHIVFEDENYKYNKKRVSIPLESGHIVLNFNGKENKYLNIVSIPLESGHIVF